MKIFFLGFFLSLSVLNLYSQEIVSHQQNKYNCLMRQGLICMQNEKYNEAIVHFQNASDLSPYYHKPYYQLILCFDIIGDTIKIYDIYKKLVLTGTKISSVTLNNVSNFSKTSLYSELIKNEDSLYNCSYKKYDHFFLEELQQLIVLKKQRFVLKQLDTLILDSLISVCYKYQKFPSALNCPSDIYRGVINTIIKNSLFGYDPESERWQIIKHLILEEFNNGGIESEYVATIIDIDLYYRNKETKYGVLNEASFPEIKNPKNENMIINRREIGLCEN